MRHVTAGSPLFSRPGIPSQSLRDSLHDWLTLLTTQLDESQKEILRTVMLFKLNAALLEHPQETGTNHPTTPC